MKNFYKFYPIKPLNGEAPMFKYTEEKSIEGLTEQFNNVFYHGIVIELAKKDDLDFQKYYNNFKNNIQTQIQHLEELKKTIEKTFEETL